MITTGNHVFDQKEIVPFLSAEKRLIRPLNYPEGTIGQGSFVFELANGKKLSEKYLDHELAGNYKGGRECHILPDWLLIYRIEKDLLILGLTRTGTHSNLFK